MNIELKIKALSHYYRMIEWAKVQNPNALPDLHLMEQKLGECWTNDHCDYCKAHCCCDGCPLFKHNCCDDRWREMNQAETWRDWIEAAEIVYKYIESKG